MSEEAPSDSVESRIATTRTELEQTLDAIEDKLNVPKQFGTLTARARASYGKNPTPWLVGATAAVVVIGGLVAWAIVADD